MSDTIRTDDGLREARWDLTAEIIASMATIIEKGGSRGDILLVLQEVIAGTLVALQVRPGHEEIALERLLKDVAQRIVSSAESRPGR